MNIRTLILTARSSALLQGHDMKSCHIEKSTISKGRVATSSCRKCGMSFQCLTDPAPNGIYIAGEAVALNCRPDLLPAHNLLNEILGD